MNSIDRKILRCQREIEAAQPKGLSFAEFEAGIHPGRLSGALYSYVSEADCRQIKGAAKEQGCKADAPGTADTYAAPPSVQKFRVGDRVRPAYKTKLWVSGVVTHASDDRVEYQIDGQSYRQESEWDKPHSLELISPASETETEGWVEWKGGECPVPLSSKVSYKLRGGTQHVHVDPAHTLRWVHTGCADIVAYKVLA